jgi:hypothetical protein
LHAFHKLRTLIALQTGGERGPVILVAFKAIDPALRESGGGFDSHTLPPSPAAFMLFNLRLTPFRSLNPIGRFSTQLFAMTF